MDFFSQDKIQQLINDLEEENLVIKTEKAVTSSNNVANEIDRVAYSYGYVDFGKDSIVFNSVLKKRIIIWYELLEHSDETLEKALAFLIEIYLSIDENNIYKNYEKLSSAIKINNKFEYTMLTDLSEGYLPSIGGFRKSILDKWCCYLDFASADIISTYVTSKSELFLKRSNFMYTLLEINGYTISDMVENKRKNNLDFIYEMIPKEYYMKISLLSTALENAANDTCYILTKYKLESEIYRYISYLFYENKFKDFSQQKQEELVERLLGQSNTLYNPDIKLNCGII